MKYTALIKNSFSKTITEIRDEDNNLLFVIKEKKGKSEITDSTGNELFYLNIDKINKRKAYVFDSVQKKNRVEQLEADSHDSYTSYGLSVTGNIFQYDYKIASSFSNSGKVNCASIYPHDELNNAYVIDLKEKTITIKKVTYIIAMVDLLTVRKKGSLVKNSKNKSTASKNED